VFLPMFSNCDRVRAKFSDAAIAEVLVSEVLEQGFTIWEVASEDLAQDRHCIIRPNDSWTPSRYKTRAGKLADSARVVYVPPAYARQQ
jgi:hypothetical protein